MTVEAPYSKYNKSSFKIWIFLCLVAAVIFAYDGYLSKYEWSYRRGFYDEHMVDGKPDGDMIFNQKSPFVFVALAAILTVWFYARKNKKLIANDNELIINGKKRIPYDSIEKINKTYFRPRATHHKSKRKFTSHPNGKLEQTSDQPEEKSEGSPEGYFIITYKNENGKNVNYKISDRKYDGIEKILNHLVAKIS